MINGKLFRDMVISGANNIENQKIGINALNVFPVPDGDTGTNMSLTFSSAADAVKSSENDSIGEISSIVSSSLLKGARGNSGVILSLLFRGLSKGFKGLDSANGAQLAAAFDLGVKAAYKAVMKPTEGTILTVARVASEKAIEFATEDKSAIEVLKYYLEVANETLNQTPDMLPALKQANVVDAGGKGYITILEGALHFLETGKIIECENQAQQEVKDFAEFDDIDGDDIKFAYCTEFIVNKTDDAKQKDVLKLNDYLRSIGDCVVTVDDEEIIKVHVHTNHPGRAIEEALRFGFLTKMKIDNMKEQHNQKIKDQKPKYVEPTKKYGFVAVAAGEGIENVFKDLGVDTVVKGGQTMNPSTDDILDAVNQTPAEIVFVLPNNKNIIMAANTAASISDKKEIVVIETKTIPQGISSLLVFDDTLSKEEIKNAMDEAIGGVKTALVTYAARDSVFDDKKIKEGQLLGLVENKVTFIENKMDDVLNELLKEILKDGGDFINIYYGEDISEQQANIAKEIAEKLAPDAEVILVYGGQPVYHYILSVE